VRDHGNGLLDGTADLPGFHQIKRLRYRLAEVEGTLDVREDDGGGVLFIVRIPTA
jgi:signal transduction histidine kinase